MRMPDNFVVAVFLAGFAPQLPITRAMDEWVFGLSAVLYSVPGAHATADLDVPGQVLQATASPRRIQVREVNQPPTAPATVTVAIVGATLIDGRGGTPIADAAVVVRGNRIVAAGPRRAVVIPAGAVLVDAAGMSVLPGLIDAHFHLDGDQGLPSLYLQHGITSVRDPGAWIEAYDSVRITADRIPRLFLAGPISIRPHRPIPKIPTWFATPRKPAQP